MIQQRIKQLGTRMSRTFLICCTAVAFPPLREVGSFTSNPESSPELSKSNRLAKILSCGIPSIEATGLTEIHTTELVNWNWIWKFKWWNLRKCSIFQKKQTLAFLLCKNLTLKTRKRWRNHTLIIWRKPPETRYTSFLLAFNFATNSSMPGEILDNI